MKFLDVGLSPLHAHAILLFDCLQEEYHIVCFDNLFMSTKVDLTSFYHEEKGREVTKAEAFGIP